MSSMRSKNALDPMTLDLPEPTPEDLIALERSDLGTAMSPQQYLDFLLAVTKDLPPSRETSSDIDEPFEL